MSVKMEFDYTIKNALPPLSWLAVLKEGDNRVNVVAGNKIEILKDGFVSGVWDGEFKDGDFENCDFACCTGAKIADDHVRFLTPHHLNACVFSLRRGTKLFFSNSMSMLLAYTNEKLTPDYYLYDSDFCCECLGMSNLCPPFFGNSIIEWTIPQHSCIFKGRC